jgi:hypothetical protein
MALYQSALLEVLEALKPPRLMTGSGRRPRRRHHRVCGVPGQPLEEDLVNG